MNLRYLTHAWNRPQELEQSIFNRWSRRLRGRLIMNSFRDPTLAFPGRKKGHPGPWRLRSDKWTSFIYPAIIQKKGYIRTAPFALSCFVFQASFACTIKCSLWRVASRSLCSSWVACNERRWYQPYTTPANRAVYRTTWKSSYFGKFGFEDSWTYVNSWGDHDG